MTIPSADDKSTPGAATGEGAVGAASAAGSQVGDQAAAAAGAATDAATAAAAASAAKAAAEQAATDKAVADKAAADKAAASVAGADGLFAGVITEADTKKTDDAAAAATKKAADEAAAAAAAAKPAEWFYAEGVPGKDKAPEWFLADKYKTAIDQAAAYPELQKKFGGFTGAPKDGKYEIVMPKDVVGNIDPEHPMTVALTKWAAERNMNQETFSEAIGLFAQYEASLVPSIDEIYKDIGDNAKERVHGLGNWAKANLMPEELSDFVAATQGPNAATVVRAFEAIAGKARQPAIGRPGADVSTGGASTEAEIAAMQAKVNPATGKRFYEEDHIYRNKVEQARIAMFKSQQSANGARNIP